ncbi:hypothetical protein JXB22_07445 [candidate division WOR-3 bacterium]|nr:hypothetical protein [candidate division WOR-3 bacterium]
MVSALFLLLVCQNGLSDPDMVVRFADHLYETREYAAALQEYRRYSFLADSVSHIAREHMIDCYIHTGQYSHALAETDLLHDPGRIHYIKGYILYEAQSYDSSRAYLEQKGLPYAEHARTLIGLGYARQFKFREAACYIDMPSALPAYKKPGAGALFSLFPGGGHFYCGRIGDGLFSFAVVSLSSALAYYYQSKDEDLKFGLCLSAAILFYAGNIYGGINAVRNYNYYLNDTYRRSVLESIEPIDPFSH